MRVLIVDNGTHYKKRLLSLVKNHSVDWIPFDELDPALHSNGYDLIILSGAYKTYEVKNYGDSIYAKEKQLVKNADPKTVIVGICLGAQLIAHIFGARLSTLPGRTRFKGVKKIWNVKKTPFNFFGYHGARVWASQKWRITDLPRDLVCWCASGEGVEVFKHRQLPIYGLQFHPEHFTAHEDGKRIFNKILEIERPDEVRTTRAGKSLVKV